MDNASIVGGGKHEAFGGLQISVGLKDEKRGIEQQRPLLRQFDSCGGARNTAGIPLRIGILQKAVKIGGHDAGDCVASFRLLTVLFDVVRAEDFFLTIGDSERPARSESIVSVNRCRQPPHR